MSSNPNYNSSAIRYKSEFQNEFQDLQDNRVHQIFRKTNFPYPLIRTRTWAYQGVKNVRFLEDLECCFLLANVLRFFILLYYLRVQRCNQCKIQDYFKISTVFHWIETLNQDWVTFDVDLSPDEISAILEARNQNDGTWIF